MANDNFSCNCCLVNDERRVMLKIFLKILSEVKKGFGFK